MALSPQWLDELRSRVTLSSVIMRTTKLQKAGHEWKACCPFHDEKTPSFTVNDVKGFYHCFGCQAHGDVISWMIEQRGMSFMDSVKELAAEAGMEVPAPDPQSAARAEKQAGLHDVMQSAQDYFVRNLHGNDGSGAQDYLKSRGFDRRVIEEFGFGYAPPDRQAMKSALSQYEEPMLIEGGLRIAVDDKEPYDRFRSRLMLPIQDTRGRVIAFGGRILETDTKAPKYLNSPDTPLFDKGSTLYNLHRANPASRQSGRIVVVEGYMDVIALANAGIEEGVAPLGTALTERQIEMLWKSVESPILCFDGDAAGQRAAMRAISRALPLLRPAHSLSIATLPSGLDPDDLIKRDGVAAFESVLKNAKSIIDTLWTYERDAVPLKTPEDKAGLKARLLEHADAILDSDIRGLYRRELLERFSEFAYPKRDRKDWKGPQPTSQDSAIKYWMDNPDARQGHLHRRLGAAIAAGLMFWPEKIADHSEELSYMAPEALDKRILIFLELFSDRADVSRGDIMLYMRNHAIEIPQATEWDELSFPFTLPDPANKDSAMDALDVAISLYCRDPLVERYLKSATKAFAQDADGALAEQKRLHEKQGAIEADLKALLQKAVAARTAADEKLIAPHA